MNAKKRKMITDINRLIFMIENVPNANDKTNDKTNKRIINALEYALHWLYQSLYLQKGYGVIIPPNSYRASKGEIEIDVNTQVIVRDFQVQKLNEIANLDSNVEVKIIHDDYDLQMLASEKKSILERLNEVEKMIQKMEDEKNAI